MILGALIGLVAAILLIFVLPPIVGIAGRPVLPHIVLTFLSTLAGALGGMRIGIRTWVGAGCPGLTK